jgi:hypothetical protein
MTLSAKEIARVCHEANAAYSMALGDYSHATWDGTPVDLKATTIDGVRHRLANPGLSPADMHENWLADKEAKGWRYGVMKNPVTKEHPCMVPWNDLPIEERLKDVLFSAIVDVLTPQPASEDADAGDKPV